ncbi:MAG: hypothetical protein A2542_04065 [Parcubacteria group bacterium RIFOXYD2_FULL_52_8]|nr:MAG: hypothetical protein A2542_04065 [Parcubacteria group bacterium RIFOXYD2_FULL_52_8]
MLKEYTYNVSTLPCGLRLLHMPFTEAASVFVKLIGKVGDRAEGAHEIGAAHFFEHLIFDGTPSMPTGPDVARTLARMGGRSNGQTGGETVRYWAHVLPEQAEGAVAWLADIFLHSLHREEDVVKERKVIAEELVSRLDNPESVFWDEFESKIYAGTPIGRTLRETMDFLPKLTREGLLAYKDRAYVAENFVLEIGGNIDHARALALAEKYFVSMASGARMQFAPIGHRTSINYILNKDVEQAKLALFFPGFSESDPDTPTAAVLAHILGGGQASRLFIKLREELHLVYNTGAHLDTLSDTGDFVVSAKLKEHKLNDATAAIIEILTDLSTNQASDNELETARNTAEMALALEAERVVGHMGAAGHQLLMTGKIETPQEEMAKIAKVTKADVLRVARNIFTKSPHVGLLAKDRKEFTLPAIT